jgi:hypothetical protein
MDARLVDPRADAHWETPPTHNYRVVFWRQRRAPADMPQEHIMWEASDYDVLDAQDIHEVIEWAESEARRRNCVYTIHAKVGKEGRGLVWLAGITPTLDSGENFGRQHPADLTPLYD